MAVLQTYQHESVDEGEAGGAETGAARDVPFPEEDQACDNDDAQFR